VGYIRALYRQILHFWCVFVYLCTRDRDVSVFAYIIGVGNSTRGYTSAFTLGGNIK
jgi:hypothetical protein